MDRAERLIDAGRSDDDLYPTRGATEQIRDRVDPVIHGDAAPISEHSLTPEQVRAYEQQGFLVVPDVFSAAETRAFIDEYQALIARPELEDADVLVREPDSDEARSVFSIHRLSRLFARLARDRRILDKVRQVLGSEVYIHHSRINIKRPMNGRSFPWHSDFETWHAEDGLPRCRVLSAWVMLTDNDEFNGPLYLVPGSHKLFVACAGATPEDHHKDSLRKQQYGVPSLAALEKLTGRGGLAAAHGGPGTLILHEGNTMHGSTDNISTAARTNLFFVYNSVHNTPAHEPFAAPRFRPEFLAGRDYTPLEPLDNDFGK